MHTPAMISQRLARAVPGRVAPPLALGPINRSTRSAVRRPTLATNAGETVGNAETTSVPFRVPRLPKPKAADPGTAAAPGADQGHDINMPYATILAVDGGGLRGIIPARVLRELEEVIVEVIKKNWKQLKDRMDPPQELPDNFHIDLADYFDLCAGTSAGSIISTYVATKGETMVEGRFGNARPGSMQAAIDLFQQEAGNIFKKEFLRQGVVASKYSADGLEGVLQDVFRDSTLKNGLKTSLLVTAFDLGSSGPFMFCHIHDKIQEKRYSCYVNLEAELAPQDNLAAMAAPSSDKQLPAAQFLAKVTPELRFFDESAMATVAPNSAARMANMVAGTVAESSPGARASDAGIVPTPTDFLLRQVVRASSAAPTFFPPAKVKTHNGDKEFTLCDGGVFCNNPEMAAMCCAMQAAAYKEHQGTRLHDMAVLSIGCGVTCTPRKMKGLGGIKFEGDVAWLLNYNLVDILMNGPNELTAAMLGMMGAGQVAQSNSIGINQFLRIQATVRNKDNKYSEALSRMDHPGDMATLLEVGDFLAKEYRDELRTFVKQYIFNIPDKK